ncbi:vitellogenin-1-like [Phlebotomus argentipes]|uniref:vitellogenin-1-like n=1 Tax=Phlebotomus argentipes TaxID=94469 RepID=UPI002892FADA|nr:vitellogenin-1-like [Phlebotomus argentipes]
MTGSIFVTFLVLCAVFTQSSGQSLLERLSSMALSQAETVYNVAKGAAKLIITPEEMVEITKEILYDLPSRVLTEAINIFCSQAIAVDGNLNRSQLIIPDAKKLGLTFFNDKGYVIYLLDDIEHLVEHPSFDRDGEIVILFMGWLSNRNDSLNYAAEILYNAYKCRGHTNFLFLDTDQFIDSLYTWSSLNTEDLGRLLVPAIVALTKHIDIGKFHILGHSLGSHIASSLGRHFQEITQTSLPRITGLDPAHVCFNQGQALTTLGSGDATFVDIIHTSSGRYGQEAVIGDVDFYPNGKDGNMPGCFSLACSHAMSWKYFAESILPGNERGFLATRCNSLSAYTQGLCIREPIPMGFATPLTAKGTYFLETNAAAPFGKNSQIRNKCVDEL